MGDVFLLVWVISAMGRDIKTYVVEIAFFWKSIILEKPQKGFNLVRGLKFPNPKKILIRFIVKGVVLDSRVLYALLRVNLPSRVLSQMSLSS